MFFTKVNADDAKQIRQQLKNAGISKPVKMTSSKWHICIGGQCSGWMSVELRKQIIAISGQLGFTAQSAVLEHDLIDTIVLSKKA